MTRFHFDVIDHTGLTRDEDGQDLPSLVAARAVAIEGIRSMLSDDLLLGFIDLSGRIDIKSVDRRLLATIRYCDAVSLYGLDDMKDMP
ncbi:DUF6894 family protein [Sphingomonas sp. PAMC 26605]|uniref:DUF6894 family protein n=1 Tax=Sphingomonas sp. PAMC 26605 TaxID=1112214 RepID=UPI00026CB124|nr:hypothetical protein [Sphingomonas sp. PAMC 26605]